MPKVSSHLFWLMSASRLTWSVLVDCITHILGLILPELVAQRLANIRERRQVRGLLVEVIPRAL